MTDQQGPYNEPTVLGAAWKYRWLVLFLAVAFAGLAYFYASSSPEYTADATLSVQDPRTSNLFDDVVPDTPERYVEGQAAIMRSRVVAKRAAEILAAQSPSVDVDVDDMTDNLTVTANETADSITITYASVVSEEEAIAVTNAVVEAYQEVGSTTAEFAFSAALVSLDESIVALQVEIANLQDALALKLANDPERQEVKVALDGAIAELVAVQGPARAADAAAVALAADRLGELGLRIETLRDALTPDPDDFELLELQTEQEDARLRLGALETRRDQLAVDADVAGSGVVFTDPAEVAEPSSVGLFVALGFLGGAILGATIASLLARRRRRFTVRKEPEAVLSTRFLADIPNFNEERIRSLLPVLDAPNSASAESFRFVAAAIALQQRGAGSRNGEPAFKSVVAVSGGVADGRSVVVANTAFAAARSGTSVLVVDADFSNQTLTEILVGSAPPLMGLTDVAAGSVPLSDAVVRVSRAETESVSLLTRGTIDVRASDFFASPDTERLMDGITRHFDLVLIDAPPLLRVAYSSTLVGLADRGLVVVRHDSDVRAAEELRHQLDLIDTPLVGYVYNEAPLRTEMTYKHGSVPDSVSGDQPTPTPTGT
jgi:Mrp family chromosome partitioning ATPase/uncharacterized protein involved in exopolysaccharide biosynthesis